MCSRFVTPPPNSLHTIDAQLYYFDYDYQPQLPVCRYYKWILPSPTHSSSSTSSPLEVFTRESLPNAGIKLSDLFSHRLHGVDNTGNVKVWEAESILAYVLLTQPQSFDDFHDK
jgi:hypothetical protein